jgi:peptide/nickel transport system substrate-binding protein
VLDPIWTTAYISRNFGYMIYDTLFGTDLEGRIKPQMVDKWSVSRRQQDLDLQAARGPGFHDGKPVTSEDVVASLTRWSSRDTMGDGWPERWTTTRRPTPRPLFWCSKSPSAWCSKPGQALGQRALHHAQARGRHPGDTQIKETIGSGPYVFKADEYRPAKGRVPEERPPDPRRAPSGTTGGKNVYVDRVEWMIVRDAQTQMNALLNGEVDILEQPAFEQYATLRSRPTSAWSTPSPPGNQFIFRFNFLHPPFNNEKIRRAAMLAMGQEAFLKTQVGARHVALLQEHVPCGTPFESEATGEYTGIANPAKARALLAEAGYKGEPVVLMRPTDLGSIAKLPLVAKQQLEQAGFKVDLQTMDWQTLVARRAKKDAPAPAAGTPS